MPKYHVTHTYTTRVDIYIDAENEEEASKIARTNYELEWNDDGCFDFESEEIEEVNECDE